MWLNILLTILGGILALLLLALVIFRLFVRLGGRRIRSIDPAGLVRPLPQPVEAERLDPHQMRLRWSTPAARAAVYGGQSPAEIDFERPLGSGVDIAELIVPNEGERRPFFAVDFADARPPVVVGERLLPLQKGTNMRDIGGYRTVDGRTVAWGKVYRGGDLSRLSQGDLAYLEQLGVRWVCDLRSEREVEERPDRLPAGARYNHLPVNEGESPLRDYFNKILFRRDQLDELMRDLYLTMVRRRGPLFGEWLAPLADPDNLPVLVHCTAGKDRTGLAITLLLGLLGVPEETILADYAYSNRDFARLERGFQLSATRLKRLGVPLGELTTLLIAHPDWLTAALDEIKAEYGSIPRFVVEAAGLSPDQIERIRQNLLIG